MGAYREVSQASAIDIKKPPIEPHEGVYQGNRQIQTKIGPNTVYEFVDVEDGTGFGIYGFTNLNRAMSQIEVGQRVRITYKGTERVQTKYGLKDVHQVSVELWEEDGSPPKMPEKEASSPTGQQAAPTIRRAKESDEQTAKDIAENTYQMYLSELREVGTRKAVGQIFDRFTKNEQLTKEQHISLEELAAERASAIIKAGTEKQKEDPSHPNKGKNDGLPF